MKVSINKIFSNWLVFNFITLVLVVLSTLAILQDKNTFQKVHLLDEQSILIDEIYNLGREDLELSNIQFRGKSTKLENSLKDMALYYNLDYIGNFILGEKPDHDKELEDLVSLTKNFISKTSKWYNVNTQNLASREVSFLESHTRINDYINKLLIKELKYIEAKSVLKEYLMYATLFFVLMNILWYAKRFSLIKKDLEALYSVDHDFDSSPLQIKEIESIYKRMSRKPQTNENPANVDPITEINNLKGLSYEFANRKNAKDSNFTTVCIFEVDHFRALDKKYPKDFTQSVLKKFSFMLSLHKQNTDIIARVDYDKFAIVMSRSSQELAFKDSEKIRKSLIETVFKAPKTNQSLKFTISGGFVIKPTNKTLEDSLKQAKEILQTAIKKGRNKIAQLRDHAEDF